MEIEINNTVDVVNETFETSFLDGSLTLSDGISFDDNATTSSANNDKTIEIERGCFSPMEIGPSDHDNQLTNKENSGFINQVTCLNACSNATLVITLIVVLGLMLIATTNFVLCKSIRRRNYFVKF